MQFFSTLSPSVRQYLLVTGNYWSFTLTDGALRMLVLLHFHALGYSPLEIAFLFLFYEIFGVVTNLVGGWLGARLGLNRTMNIGLTLQVCALAMLLVPSSYLSVPWVMAAQGISGIAKDLNKMSAKSSIKLLLPSDAQGALYHWIALLTGSKNALKGIGFFMGGALLALMGFRGAVLLMAIALAVVLLLSKKFLRANLGKAKAKARFKDVFSKSRSVNILATARLFLFASRDAWFVIALPVFLASQFNWSHWQVGAFLASWIIGYGAVQAIAPKITASFSPKVPDGRTALLWGGGLTLIPALIALALYAGFHPQLSILLGLMVFAVLFAVNSSVHSYLIVAYARDDGVSMDVGFYYMANALGRLGGTLLSGWVFQTAGLQACLLVSTGLLLLATLVSFALPKHKEEGNSIVNAVA
ncbi:organoarsenical effux MFS transporter ArsJ [Microbulbifer sp. CnH-101-G]|uniref:organoarsenical effux MFS transporter ArsJ n=1 Tax=Microbulbifer sp. CnH-101-G TaxID=3243393 RepID=UPI004039D35A